MEKKDPFERQMIHLQEYKDSKNILTLVTYNILADAYIYKEYAANATSKGNHCCDLTFKNYNGIIVCPIWSMRSSSLKQT
jgi:mRNA deadenylase 3'-5' endonuclease subunit Ccr4